MCARTALNAPSAPTTRSAVASTRAPPGPSNVAVPARSSSPVHRWSNVSSTFGCCAAARINSMLSALRLKLMMARVGSAE